MQVAWGGVGRGMWLTIIRYAILKLEKRGDPKTWRPNILVLSGSPKKRWRLIELANDLTNGNALFTVSTILPQKNVTQEKVLNYEKQITDFLEAKNVQALVRVVRASNPFSGAIQLVNAYGLGPLVPNTVLLGDTREVTHHKSYAEMISHFHKSRRNVVIVQGDDVGFKKKETVDIWWGGLKGNGSLMIILAYLLKNSREWQGSTLNIKMVVASEEASQQAKENLTNILSKMRIGFTYHILVSKEENFWDVMARESANSDLVMMGLGFPEGEEEKFEEYFQKLKENTKSLPTKIFVLAAQNIKFEEVLK